MPRRWDIDERTFVTDNGPECNCTRNTPGLYIYKLVTRTDDWCDIVGQCASCHAILEFRIALPNPDIFQLKSRHEYVITRNTER